MLDLNLGVADGFEAGEAIADLGGELGDGVVGRVGRADDEVDVELRRNAGDAGSGRFLIRRNTQAADEAEIDDVAGQRGIVAVAQSGEDVGVGEHGGLDGRAFGR